MATFACAPVRLKPALVGALFARKRPNAISFDRNLSVYSNDQCYMNSAPVADWRPTHVPEKPVSIISVGPDREQAGVPPDVGRSRRDRRPAQRREVVADLQRPEALGAGVLGAQLAGVPALAAGQVAGESELG